MAKYEVTNNSHRDILIPSGKPYDILKTGKSRSVEMDEAVAKRLASVAGVEVAAKRLDSVAGVEVAGVEAEDVAKGTPDQNTGSARGGKAKKEE